MTEKSKRLTPSEWAEIVTLYERGEATQQEIADRYGVSRQAINGGLRERNIVMGSKVNEIISEANEASEKARKLRIEEVTSMKKRFITYNNGLANMAMKRVSEASQPGGVGLAAINPELVAIKNAMYIVQKGREENYALYDVATMDDDSDDMPDLSVSTYSSDELSEIQRANEEAYHEHLNVDDTDEEEG